MSRKSGIDGRPGVKIPADDLRRGLAVARDDKDGGLAHIAVVGDTYTILLTGKDTKGRFCLIDMLVPPGGGPPPHRHDFEETFILLEGEVDVTFRGKKSVARAGVTVNVPSNAPHQFHNSSNKPARLLCICSPAGMENFFLQMGIPVKSRTSPAPKLDKEAQEKLGAKLKKLAPKFRTEMLKSA
ncbi:MAG: cupin domain-containing protein [Candidatus Acidiferrales bacterium]|jgi:quercetin dioxygenase-like cupin family protein